MAKGKSSNKHQTKKTRQVIVGDCPSCNAESEVVHTQYIGAKKRWAWACKKCGADCRNHRTVMQ